MEPKGICLMKLWGKAADEYKPRVTYKSQSETFEALTRPQNYVHVPETTNIRSGELLWPGNSTYIRIQQWRASVVWQ